MVRVHGICLLCSANTEYSDNSLAIGANGCIKCRRTDQLKLTVIELTSSSQTTEVFVAKRHCSSARSYQSIQAHAPTQQVTTCNFSTYLPHEVENSTFHSTFYLILQTILLTSKLIYLQINHNTRISQGQILIYYIATWSSEMLERLVVIESRVLHKNVFWVQASDYRSNIMLNVQYYVDLNWHTWILFTLHLWTCPPCRRSNFEVIFT